MIVLLITSTRKRKENQLRNVLINIELVALNVLNSRSEHVGYVALTQPFLMNGWVKVCEIPYQVLPKVIPQVFRIADKFAIFCEIKKKFVFL